ncbi:MAG TPA: hypothetical protein VK356_01915 [Thermomicrobiales bacterium]|nr:hypothetical protein [Thermomicrobiales bacterium]
MSLISPSAPSRSLNSSTVTILRDALTGSVITPADSGYDEARAVWNGMIDRYPALVVRCATAGDVIAALDFAR